jgi:hypothetical protein
MGMRFYIATPKGEVMARLDQDVDGAHRAISGTLITTLGEVFQLVLATSALISLDWQLGLSVLILFPCFFIPARYWALRLRDDSQDAVLATRECASPPDLESLPPVNQCRFVEQAVEFRGRDAERQRSLPHQALWFAGTLSRYRVLLSHSPSRRARLPPWVKPIC